MAVVDTGWKLGAVALAVSLGLTGCGVRGSLDPPPVAKAEGTATSPEAADPGENSAARPKPHRDFLLDGLLR